VELEEQLAQAGSLGTTSSLKATLVDMMGGKSALGKRWVGVCCILVHAVTCHPQRPGSAVLCA